MQAGSKGMLAIDGVGFPLACIVKRSGDDSLALVFTLDAGTAAKFAGVPQQLERRHAA